MQRLSRRYSENEAVQAILEMWSESPQPVFPVRGPSKRGQLPALDFLSPRTRHLWRTLCNLHALGRGSVRDLLEMSSVYSTSTIHWHLTRLIEIGLVYHYPRTASTYMVTTAGKQIVALIGALHENQNALTA